MLHGENIMRFSLGIIAFLASADCFIIPEEFPSLLSLVYSNIPPIKKGTDSRVGLGFRLGQHADFQILLELGPQTNTDPLGSATPEYTAKREVLVMKNANTLVDYVNNLKNYFSPEKKKSKISNTAGGKWIEWWRNNVLSQKEIGKIQFNKIPGIDDRIDNPKKVISQKKNEKSAINRLRDLYKEQGKKT